MTHLIQMISTLVTASFLQKKIIFWLWLWSVYPSKLFRQFMYTQPPIWHVTLRTCIKWNRDFMCIPKSAFCERISCTILTVFFCDIIYCMLNHKLNDVTYFCLLYLNLRISPEFKSWMCLVIRKRCYSGHDLNTGQIYWLIFGWD